MATDNPRVWFKSISLENVRSFGTRQTIYFTEDGTENGKAARWNVILGDNGTGKTTVLKGLANSYISIAYSKILGGLNGRHTSLHKLIRSNRPNLNIWTEYQIGRYEGFKHHLVRVSGLREVVELLKEEDKEVEELELSDHSVKHIKVFGYGASRRIGNGAITKPEFYSETDSLINSTVNLFKDDSNLLNAEEWLVQSEYISLKEPKFKDRYSKVFNLLRKLFRGEIFDIYIDTTTGTPQVFFKTHYGDVRLHELSLGYKTLIAWMVDFAKGLLDRYPDSKDPLAEPAVCLVDEIDLHLHPKFQRTIIQFLTETFPNTQFIVTAHSPLIVVAAEERPLDANIILLKREGDQTVIINDPVDVSKWSVDQILNSDLFGHVPPASEPLIQLRTERDALLAKAKLTKKEQGRLTELDGKIGFVPFGRDQAEIKAETIIQQLADVLRSKQSV